MTTQAVRVFACFASSFALACAGGSGDDDRPITAGLTFSSTAAGETGAPDGTQGEDSANDDATSDGESSESGEVMLDVGGGETGPPTPEEVCEITDDMNAVGGCRDQAPPDAFEPEVQWNFMGPAGYNEAITMPLVANLTDDNADGQIDLCDTPDVVVVAGPGMSDVAASRLYVLDGESGTPHFFADAEVQFAATPALGDIDGDGLVEIVAVTPGFGGQLIAFEHDGTVKWQADWTWAESQSSALALADLDADGDVEIVAGTHIADHNGELLWAGTGDFNYSASVAVDLDGDDRLELLTGFGAYRSDGSVMWVGSGLANQDAHPQVADFDDDGEPEVLFSGADGLFMFEADGTKTYGPLAPTGEPTDWNRPVTIHDFDGDGQPEFGASAPNHFGVYEGDASPVWTLNVTDVSGQAGGTAFDFIGSGTAQAVYADEFQVYVLDGVGSTLMSTPRRSGTVLEYPVVADIDNDRSAEILVVSNTLLVGGPIEYTIQAVRDVEDRWVQARRIWNQHTYHVTNVREDGTIPQFEPKHWDLLNTFRTQAQIEGGVVCEPEG